MQKSTTGRISLKEPDEDRLRTELVGRDISPELFQFLKNLLKAKKWTRKINIPSGHTGVAAVLAFTSQLKEGGLEIFSELHVFHMGKAIAEKWEVCGETEQTYRLPKEAFMAIEIEKVRVNGPEVSIEFRVPTSEGDTETLVRVFDFSDGAPGIRVVPHPLLRREIARAVDDAGRDSFGMSTSVQPSARDKIGILEIVGGITSDEGARAIKADLEDLPGVHAVVVMDVGIKISFDPVIVTGQQFELAVRAAGFQSSGFHIAA